MHNTIKSETKPEIKEEYTWAMVGGMDTQGGNQGQELG